MLNERAVAEINDRLSLIQITAADHIVPATATCNLTDVEYRHSFPVCLPTGAPISKGNGESHPVWDPYLFLYQNCNLLELVKQLVCSI